MEGSRARFSAFFSSVVCLVGWSSCATTGNLEGYSSRDLMAAACPSDFWNAAHPKLVRGSIWAQIESTEINGQFPATVRAHYPGDLGIEVTNLIGAPQAWLKVENGKAQVRLSAENESRYGKRPSRESFGGLPLLLAPRFFAGGVPCPHDEKNAEIRIRKSDQGELVVEERYPRTAEMTRYVYRFTRYAGKPWVKEVRWETRSKSDGAQKDSRIVTLHREEPLDPDGAPKKFTASSEQGTLRVRWKDRSVSFEPLKN